MKAKRQLTLNNRQEAKKMFLNHCLLLNEKHMDAQIAYCYLPIKVQLIG